MCGEILQGLFQGGLEGGGVCLGVLLCHVHEAALMMG